MSDEKQPEQKEPLSLARKILEIQSRVGMVKKKGKFGSEMGGSNYLRIEDSVQAVNKLMAEYGLILYGSLAARPDQTLYFDMQPHYRSGKGEADQRSGYMSTVVMEWTLEDTESGDKRIIEIPGTGYDGTDKAVYKAQTGSRKYAIIIFFNLAVGNDVESDARQPTFEEGKQAQRRTAEAKIAQAAGRGNPTAIDAISQIDPEKKIIISRPQELNGHYIKVEGYVANPPLDQFFTDTDSKRFQSKFSKSVSWRVPAEYEKGLLQICEKLGIEVTESR